jgi:glycosyl-4,4'-diaponeurosporenoate acyltransferase
MIELPVAVSLALNVLVWGCLSFAIGYIGHRRSIEAFAQEQWWSTPRAFERDGAIYGDAFRIKRWKDRLPELGGLFPGGFAKRSARGHLAHLERFVIETRRAEWVHWWVFMLWPVFAIWNPGWAVGVMWLYATVSNLPCIIVQRYNRARLLRLLASATRRRAAAIAPGKSLSHDRNVDLPSQEESNGLSVRHFPI